MTIRPFGLAISAALLGFGLIAGSAQAQSSMDSMKKPDAMKMGGTKADCLHKAGMERDSMKKSDMMKHCDAMK